MIISYDRMALKIGIAQSYYSYSALKNEIIEKKAKFFNLEPEYFFEYRLAKHIKILENNPKLLDSCEKYLKNLKKKS